MVTFNVLAHYKGAAVNSFSASSLKTLYAQPLTTTMNTLLPVKTGHTSNDPPPGGGITKAFYSSVMVLVLAELKGVWYISKCRALPS